MENKIKELTKEIDRLLGGEIMELKFGCEVEWQFTHHLNSKSSIERVKKGIFVNYGSQYPMPMNVLFYGNSTCRAIPIEEVEILGRPITLEDVMRAIKNTGKGRDIFVNLNGNVIARYVVEDYDLGEKYETDFKFKWELGKPLSLQSPETIDKIAEILGVK